MRFTLKAGVAAVAFLLIASTAAAQTGGSFIKGSAHDFYAGPNANYNFWPASYGLCSSCHSAHNAQYTDAPLWNHDYSVGPWVMYTDTVSATLNGTVAPAPQGVSRACLGCHDGTIAINAIGGTLITNATVTGAVTVAGTGADLTTDLRDDHPISIQYNEIADTKLRAKSTVLQTFPLYGAAKDQVECGSCHDPHTPGTNGLFFRSYSSYNATTNPTGYASRCNVCHIK